MSPSCSILKIGLKKSLNILTRVSMKIHRILKLWNNWLKENQSRFSCQPYISKIYQNRMNIKFEGISPSVYLELRTCGNASIYVNYNGMMADALTWDPDISVSYDKEKGFYCGLCLPEYIEYYPTAKDLYEQHCFETLLKWCNENFKPGAFLRFYGYPNPPTANCVHLIQKGEKGLFEGQEVTVIHEEPLFTDKPTGQSNGI